MPAPDAIQHLVVAVEEAGAVAAHQPFELILRQQPAAQNCLLKIAERRGRRAQLAPDRLQLAVVDDVHVECALGQLFGCFDLGHGTPCLVDPMRNRAALPLPVDSGSRPLRAVTPCSVIYSIVLRNERRTAGPDFGPENRRFDFGWFCPAHSL